ncbi:Lysophospholipase, alpha-beta hydrolase superfamily [Geodermatophilus siccatus]|uniref:Lysophospholipase, alpha-beta hydrolase superfamily n=1 Tax=Geodermatophilus siccatus TaxID=1137991 RepID=A0A1G9S0T0_9ACTN|nr:alpha/beta fold hydrolase [Geodermatophilus siccatus]SDM29109.1 Lysophospholipase, alpha-beta hydrolase superfamily [Geodermatophilus siccatus]
MTSGRQPHTVRSADGTVIAFERTGSGPPLVLVDAAGHFRGLSSFSAGLIDLLARDFTVVHHDRRGRGDSGDTPPYAVEREVEDLAALIEDVGGAACLYGFSSGGLVALQAAARGLPIPAMVLLEPPIGSVEDRPAQAAFTVELEALVSAGRRDAALEHFLSSIGVPAEMVAEMRGSPAWTAMESVAHTLVYDSRVSEATTTELRAAVTVPTLVLDSQGSSDDLTGMAASVAAQLRSGSHRSLPGSWHGVADEDLAAVLVEFLHGRSGGC